MTTPANVQTAAPAIRAHNTSSHLNGPSSMRSTVPVSPFKALLVSGHLSGHARRTEPRGRTIPSGIGSIVPAQVRGAVAGKDHGGAGGDGEKNRHCAPTPEHRARSASKSEKMRATDDPLDPSTRQMAQLAPPTVTPPNTFVPGNAAPEVRARASLEDLLPALVRKIAWAGDARRGSVRMEIGSGALAGGTVIVHADEGRVRVEITTPAGVDPGEWRRRITERLEQRGITVDGVLVT